MRDVVRVPSNGLFFPVDSVSQPRASESLPASPKEPHQESQKESQAKRYSRIKISVRVAGTFLFFAVSFLVLLLGISSWLGGIATQVSNNPYVALLVFAALFGLGEIILGLPLSFFSGFYLEHRFKLSNQTFWKWAWEGMKGIFVGIPLTVPLLLTFYFCLRNFAEYWWLPVGTILFFFSVVLARIAPILIFPLFYKFKPVEDASLKSRILHLCAKVGVNVEGIFVFDMSKNTKKANAAFTGIGKSKRIILGDTLVANFTDDEIESVFAHELGHYKLKHLWTMIAVGTVSTFLGLYVTANLYAASLPWFAFSAVDELAALPLLTMWLGLYSLVTSPLSNMLSRAHERSADLYALRTTGNKDSFINAMRKLAKINLADTSPHPLIEFLFHSHPSIEKRIHAAERY
ncbi:MAG: M48 family metallopeptidase [Ignavibacteriales bacterium]|nr:M48 family metallopeptidase [Ignavibacteriales bacterium]